MSASNRALAWENLPPQAEPADQAHSVLVSPEEFATPASVPILRVVPLLTKTHPKRFVRVPTHAIGVHTEQRENPRASLKLPLKLRSVDGLMEQYPVTLVTRNISSSGVFFLCPKLLGVGAEIELDIVLVSRPLGYGNVVVSSKAEVRRIEPAHMPGWYGIAASFDDFAFDRDVRIPGWLPAD